MDTICFTEYLIILPILEASTVLSFIYFTYQFIKSKKSIPDKWLYLLAITAFITQTIHIIFASSARTYAAITSNCSNGDIDIIHAALSTVAIIGVFMQYHLMLLIMFIRLNFLFQGTQFQISSRTIITFFLLFIMAVILTMLYAVLYFLYYHNADSDQLTLLIGLITACFSLLIIMLSSMLNILFVYKLIKVNRQIYKKKSDAQRLISTITKISILSLVCIVSTLFVTAMGVTTQGLVFNSIHGWFAHAIAVSLDVCTNFICIFLSFHAFNGYYVNLCGCCDVKCKGLCRNFVGGDELELVKQMSVTTTDSPTSPTNTVVKKETSQTTV